MTASPFPVRLFATGAFGFALIGAIPATYGLALPVYRTIFDLAEGQSGLVLTMHNAGAFAAVLAGMFGLPYLSLRLALALLAAGTALIALQPGWSGLLVGIFVEGAGYGLLAAIVNRRFLSDFGRRGPGMVALVNALFGIGAILAPPLFLLAGSVPWPVFAGAALCALLLIPVVQPTGRGLHGAAGLPPLRNWRTGILAFNFCGIGVEVILTGFGPTALLDAGLSEPLVAGLASGFFAAFLASRLALWWLTTRLPADFLYAGAFALAAVSCALTLVAPAAGFVLSGAAVGALFPLFYVWASELLGRDERVSAAILTAGLLGAVIVPALTGVVLGALGTAALFPLTAGFTGVLAVTVTLSIRPARAAAA